MFEKITAQNGVVYFRSTLIPCTHGFSTRIGGVSKGESTKALNLAFGRGDDEDTVLENLSLFSCAVGFDKEKIVSVPQIHSAKVEYVGKESAGFGYFKESKESFDGYVTDVPGIVLGVKTADCVPILFAWVRGKDKKVMGVGAVHAGWRGTVAGISSVCISKLIEMGAEPSEIFCAIGPAIHPCCYDVGKDFFDTVKEKLGDRLANLHIKELTGQKGRYSANLPALNKSIISENGVPKENIDVCGLCTGCHPELFYSHRKSQGKRGTMCNVIVMH